MRIIECALFALLIPGAAVAQDSIRVLSPGTPIRLILADRPALSGRAVASTDSTLTVRTSSGTETIRRSSIQRSELRRGAPLKTALIAGVAGVALGVAGAYAFKDFGCQYEGCDRAAHPMLGAVYVGAPFAVFGAFAGELMQRWKVESTPIVISAPAGPSTVTGGSMITARDCSVRPGGHASLGLTISGGLAANAGVEISCRPNRWFSVEWAYVDVPDRRIDPHPDDPFTGGTQRRSVRRASLIAERFLAGPLRGAVSIDFSSLRVGSEPYQRSERTFGTGVSLSGSRRVRGSLGLRGGLQLHIRDNVAPEVTALFGLERMR